MSMPRNLFGLPADGQTILVCAVPHRGVDSSRALRPNYHQGKALVGVWLNLNVRRLQKPTMNWPNKSFVALPLAGRLEGSFSGRRRRKSGRPHRSSGRLNQNATLQIGHLLLQSQKMCVVVGGRCFVGQTVGSGSVSADTTHLCRSAHSQDCAWDQRTGRCQSRIKPNSMAGSPIMGSH